jgi:hypothetical protein
MIAKEIQEMRDALESFQTAFEVGEVAGFKKRGDAFARQNLIQRPDPKKNWEEWWFQLLTGGHA